MALQYSFDVETRRGSRWVIDCTREREYPARKRANELLANPKCPGARIIRTWKRADGVSVDTEIFCQTREIRDDDHTLRITPVDTPIGKCQTLKDFFGFESRQAMSRIFRTYLAGLVLTPTEIIHNLWHLNRLHEKDGLIRSAVDMVASAQARDGEQTSADRRNEIYQAVDAMVARARTLDTALLPKLDRTFGDVMGALGGCVDSDQRRYLMMAALSRELGKHSSWVGKLDYLCTLAAAESVPEALDMLDGVIADIFAIDVKEEVLGVQPTLRAMIRALLDLADGIAPPGTTHGVQASAGLYRLLASGTLPASRRSLIARAHRALRSPGPLRPNDFAQEPEELRQITARFLTPTGLLSGAETAHALTTRFSRMIEQGGKTGRRAAIKGVFLAMPDRAYGAIYLCDLARSDIGKEHLPDIAALFTLVQAAPAFGDFCQRDLPPLARLARATAAYHAVDDSPFPSEIKSVVTFHIDALLERFVIDEAIIDKLDLAHSHLRDRAERLVRFCQADVLPKGKAQKAARDRVLVLLKQSDFPARFVAGIDDKRAAQAALRDFFVLLQRCGMHDG